MQPYSHTRVGGDSARWYAKEGLSSHDCHGLQSINYSYWMKYCLFSMGELALFSGAKCNGEGGGHWAIGRSCASGEGKDGLKSNIMQASLKIRTE